MAVNIVNLIGAINPKIYCENSEEIEKIVKEKGILEASKKVKLKQTDYIDIIDVRLSKNVFSLQGIKNPIEDHSLSYDSLMQSLEQTYFWIIDYINSEYKGAEKLVDSFLASPGSGHFSEMSQRSTKLQEEGMKIFGLTNTVLRSILNIIYDLKEFKMRLKYYDDYRKGTPVEKEAAFFSLKQIWLDQVDIKKGGTSLKQLAITGANQPGFVMLIDAFMAADSVEKAKKIDLNDRNKRIIVQRISEFLEWHERSEEELRKRFNIEKTYLKTQVNTLNLYMSWAKPYLKALHKLKQDESLDSAELVTNFNTALFQLTLLGKAPYDPIGDIQQGDLPELYKKLIKDKRLRNYNDIVVVDLKFRSIPDRSDQRGGYTYRGKVDIRFTSFALTDEEIETLKKEMQKDDFDDAMKAISGATDESIGEIKKDLDEFLDDNKKEKEKKDEEEKRDKAEENDINPFKSLFSFLKGENKEKKKDNPLKSDSEYEKVIRSQALLDSRWRCRKFYDEYKKAHGMKAFPPVQF